MHLCNNGLCLGRPDQTRGRPLAEGVLDQTENIPDQAEGVPEGFAV